MPPAHVRTARRARARSLLMVMQNGDEVDVPFTAMPQLGRYRVLATLGQGGMGTIQLAVAGGLGGFRKLFVLKVLREDLTLDDKFVEMFMREATLAACLNHANVIHTVEAAQQDGRYFLVMEFLDGQPYSEILRRSSLDPTVPLAMRLQILCDVLAGLHYAHDLTDYDGRALHLVHRDVSPANVFVTYDGHVKLLDFGIATARDAEGTQPGEFKGKVGYAAPEQLRGGPADRRIDVFAAGVVLWETIALRHLVRGKPTRATVEARLSGLEPRIAQIVADVDPTLAAICDKAMHVEPELRYPSADAFRRALAAYLAERNAGFAPSAVRQMMRSKFAIERADMHRMIDMRLREGLGGEPSSTAIRQWSWQSVDTSSGSLRLGSRHNRESEESLPSVKPVPRAKRSGRWLFAGAAGAALIATLVSSLRPTSKPPQERTERGPDPSSRAQPEPAQPSEAPPPPHGGDDQSAPLPPAPPPPAVVEPSATPSATTSTAQAPAEPAVAHEPKSPARDKHATRSGRQQPSAQSAAGTSSTAADSGPGELDLHKVQRRARRSLDEDNPFR